jgi:hypothetical protein
VTCSQAAQALKTVTAIKVFSSGTEEEIRAKADTVHIIPAAISVIRKIPFRLCFSQEKSLKKQHTEIII